jgi:hypothetical protein
MNVAAIFLMTIRTYSTFIVSAAVTGAAMLWSIKSAAMYIAPMVEESSKGLALYPVILFYLFLALFILHMSIE